MIDAKDHRTAYGRDIMRVTNDFDLTEKDTDDGMKKDANHLINQIGSVRQEYNEHHEQTKGSDLPWLNRCWEGMIQHVQWIESVERERE